MKNKYIIKQTIGIMLLILILISGCTKQDDLIEELDISREFAPVGLTLKIRQQVKVEMKWTAKESISSYEVDISESDPTFNNIVRTLELTSDQLPYQESLDGETLYYIRVKGISNRGLDDSSYAVDSISTNPEQLFLPEVPGDIQATEATLRWVPNSEVTHIDLNTGEIIYEITEQDKVEGIANITGLTGETEYTATLMKETKKRGVTTFTTGIDVGDATLVTPEDDLTVVFAEAQEGDVLVFKEGDYRDQIYTFYIYKNLTIRGLRSYDKPLLGLSFKIISGANVVEFIDLDLDGSPAGHNNCIRWEEGGEFDTLLVKGCNIHDYGRSFISGNSTNALIQNIIVEDCVVTNILTDGGDFFDFRESNVLNVEFVNSTFNNCAPERDFFRIDAAGASTGTGKTCNILLENCTLYKCSNNDSRRILYVRFEDNEIEVRKTIITDTAVEGYSDRSGTDEDIVYYKNNYFNAPTLYDPSVARYDDSGTYTLLDPVFADPENGDFKLGNQDLIDEQVGDPRWWQ